MVLRKALHEQMRAGMHRDRRTHQALRLYRLLRVLSVQQRYRYCQRPNNQRNRPPTAPRAPGCPDRYHVPIVIVLIKFLVTIRIPPPS